MNETKFEPDFMAFWSYDKFPYLLGGPVKEFKPGGFVITTTHGNSAFKPRVLLPMAEGERLAKDLRMLESEHRNAIDAVHDHFKDRLKVLTSYAEIPK